MAAQETKNLGFDSDVGEEGQTLNQEVDDLRDKIVTAMRQGDDDALKHLKKRLQERGELSVGLSKYNGQLLCLAAKYNRLDRLLDLIPNVDVNEACPDGGTALHAAAESGSLDAVKTLLWRGANSKAQNLKGLLPLHTALRSRSPDLEVLRVLVQRYVEEVELVQASVARTVAQRRLTIAVDNMANTPLHMVAIYMSASYEECLRVVTELKRFDPCKKNRSGDSPLHIAAARGNVPLLEAMLKVFYGAEKNVDSHPTDKDGDTLLDIAAVHGFDEMVVLLLDYGADPRRGVLFKIVSESVRRPDMAAAMCHVYRLIVHSVDKWADGQDREEIIAVINSASERNGDLNVVEFAVEEGAVELLAEIVHTEALYEFHSDFKYRFCVSHCLPSKERISLLERIALYDKTVVGAGMLNIQPFRYLSSRYLWYSTLFYAVFFVLQLVYMICFSIYCIPDACELSTRFQLNAASCNATGGSPNTKETIFKTKIGFLIWPVVSLILNICLKIYQLGWVFVRRFEIVAQVFVLSFGTIVIVWFLVLIQGSSYNLYTSVTALLFIFGWLQTFYYLSYLGELYIFTNLVKEIIFKDVLKLGCTMAFVVVGFSLAIHSLSQTEVPYTDRSLKDTVYLTFASTMNLGDLFEDTVGDSGYSKGGGNETMLRVIFLAYIVTSFVILLNILIAMMSDTYQSNNKNTKAIWKFDVLKVSLALMITRKDTADEVILPEVIAGPIIRSLPEQEEALDDIDNRLLPFGKEY